MLMTTKHTRLKAMPFVLAVCLLLPAVVDPAAPAPLPSALEPLDFDRGASGLGLALRRVGTTARVLYVTAHPDDEHNGILVRLSRGLGLRTALLTVTRGEGGQNAIGPELFDALGVLRTGELLALHRYDGVEQYFGRAYEFGYSFSVEETLAKWGRDETIGDIVRVIRAFRPDVILARNLERIFNLFDQGGVPPPGSAGGLGIGLSLARSVIEMHGGTIEAHSAGPNQGSEFEVRLPLADGGSGQAEGADLSSAASAQSRRILLVDDNADAADSLALILRALGHEVRTAYEGPGALQAARGPAGLKGTGDRGWGTVPEVRWHRRVPRSSCCPLSPVPCPLPRRSPRASTDTRPSPPHVVPA